VRCHVCPSEGTSGRLSVRRWLLGLTRERLDSLVHVGTVRVDRALHRRRWSRRRRGPRAG
jgi:hypothetical protein